MPMARPVDDTWEFVEEEPEAKEWQSACQEGQSRAGVSPRVGSKDQRSESPTIEIAMGLGICAKSSSTSREGCASGQKQQQHKTKT